jgi:hypothetical protein
VVSDQLHPYAMPGQGPVATMDREELKSKLDNTESIKLVMALNRWAFEANTYPARYISMIRTISVHRSRRMTRSSSIARTSTVSPALPFTERWSSAVIPTFAVTRGGLLDWEEAGLTIEGSPV